tara:strand:+ start:251 stop:448 length:198 start_codon:yes stop_codon:yes gene_type:complete
MDEETYLKEIAKHVQRNTTNPKSDNPNQNKIQISMFKNTQFIDLDSMELYRQIMMDRYGNNNDQE